MSATKPFKTREATNADGKPIKVFDNIWVYYKSKTHPGKAAFIDISGKEAGLFPTVSAVIFDVLSHTLNVGIKPIGAVVVTGLRHISDPNASGLRYCRDDEAELDFLLAWAEEHGRTGGTGDPSIMVNPGSIPWEPYVEPGGKHGEQPPNPTGGPVGTEHPGKTGEGGAQFHDADRDHDHEISEKEAKKHEKRTGEKVEPGPY